jgi:hypothetical protein
MISLRADKKIEVPIPALDGASGIVYFGSDDETVLPIEVLLAAAPKAPTVPEMRSLFKWRKNDRSNLVVIAIETKGRVHLYGPAEDRQPISVEAATAERVLQAALEDPTPLMARRSLVSFYDNFGSTEMAGIKNKGLFATHHLRDNLPQRKDWKDLQSQGQDLAKKRHRELITALGFEISTEERNTLILKAGPGKRVVAVLLEDNETFDSPSGRFPSSPVAWGLTVAADNNVPWLIVLKKDQIRLHPGRDGVGVGQKGQAETFLELNLAQIDEQHLALLPLVFSASSLEKDGDVQKILDESSKYAVILGARLRERVYESVVPTISIAVAKKLQSQGFAMDSEGLQKAYSITLKILFRLLFQAYAEDRGLLPAGRNEGYDANSLKTIAKRDIEANPEDFGNVVNIWHDLVQVWDSIDEGNPRWQVPAYNGGLFGRDPELHPEGALIKSLELTDKVLGPALQALLIDMTEDGVRGPVDFRSLSVREFGTIYEGLLESSLSLAEIDLTVDNKDAWVPAKDGDTIMAKAGEPYFHSASGDRKATGSYFTPKFVVDHLVERAIDPTIDKHLDRISAHLKAGDQAAAYRQFFDFRVADLAMGSAHFLVAAVDRIEAKMRSFLSNSENNVPGVLDEIERLRKAASDALQGDEIAISEIEDPSLLRRQIARRCIYGIDINPMAVELARLAIWIHTFVPGLPMSSLDHNLVCANSLTGIGSVEEALDALIPNRKGQATFFDDAIISGLELARDLLTEVAIESETDKAQVRRGAERMAQARLLAENSRLIFDSAIASRMKILDSSSFFSEAELVEAGKSSEVVELVNLLNPAHMPYLFPEVFLREEPGFDALIGNPPWEKVKIDEQRWWGIRLPGVRALAKDKKARAITEYRLAHPQLNDVYLRDLEYVAKLRKAMQHEIFPGMGAGGDLDLANVFSWRNWHFLRPDGRMGLVLPRNAMSASALTPWRSEILLRGGFESVVFASNRKEWLFAGVDERQSVCFVTISKSPRNQILVAGPIHNRKQLETVETNSLEIPVEEFRKWSDSLAFPLVNDERALNVFRTFQLSPKVLTTLQDGTRIRAYCELHATNDGNLFSTDLVSDESKVPIWGGSSFNIWDPNFGGAWARSKVPNIREILKERFIRASGNKKSPYFGWSPDSDLQMDYPRVAYRWVTNRTNQRTTIACLIPAGAAVNSAPVFVFPKGSNKVEAFLLGVISSVIFDWQARNVVEGNLTFELLGNMACPWDKLDTDLGLRVIEISATLACVDERFDDWIHQLGFERSKGLSSDEKEAYVAELDALVALMYRLSEEDVEYMFSTFHRGWDYRSRLDKVLEYYVEWKDK